jgi:hypothetical protein
VKNNVHSGSSLRDIASSESRSLRAADDFNAQILPDYFQVQVAGNEDYLLPVGDEVYLQPVCGGEEHFPAEIGIGLKSVNFRQHV